VTTAPARTTVLAPYNDAAILRFGYGLRRRTSIE